MSPQRHEPGSTARGEVAVSAQLGRGARELGAIAPEEANPRGPLSFTVSKDEQQIFVLDQENQRIQVYQGDELEHTIALPSSTVVDLGLLDDGNLVLLDPVADKVSVIDQRGMPVSQAPVSGVGIPDAQMAQGLRVRSDGVWVGYRGRITRVLDAKGAVDPARPMLFGQLTRDEKYVISLSISGTTLGVLKRERSGVPQNHSTALRFDQPVIHVLISDSDAAGNLYIVTLHMWGKGDAQQAKTLLTVLSPELHEIKHLTLPTQETAHEVFRYGEVGASGALYYMDLGHTAAHVRRFQ